MHLLGVRNRELEFSLRNSNTILTYGSPMSNFWEREIENYFYIIFIYPFGHNIAALVTK